MTTETLKNPTVATIPDAVGIDKAIQNVANALATIPWLTKSFGRAWSLPTTMNGKTVQEPKVYQGSKEYYPVLPNDALNSFSFWRVNGARSSKEWSSNMNPGANYIMEDPVDLIVWFNMQAIDPTKDYVFKELLIRDVLNKLTRFNRIVVQKIWDDKIEDIYRGYAIEERHRDLLKYPFGAFRIEIILGYQFECQIP